MTDCSFAGPADGESALKECSDIIVKNCRFSLRYPLWHANGFVLADSNLDAFCRAPIWYAKKGLVDSCTIDGIKCLRECEEVNILNCRIHSPEFGWKCRKIKIKDCEIESEYLLFDSSDITINNLKMSGKYSFQYIKNMTLDGCSLNTKDAFWHTEEVTVKNSLVNGEYLGWYSDGLTLVNCRISGTQPFCYCNNLTLINCTMDGCDLAFENSEVNAEIAGKIDSVKNPRSGSISAASIGEIITDCTAFHPHCTIALGPDRKKIINI